MNQLQFNKQTVSMKLDDGREISIETGMLARQADGAVLVRCGNAAILATVVASKEPRPGQSFFPLSVDYQEKFAAAGRIPGSFFKREGRISDPEILISRLVDRALRPLFPENYYNDVQVLVTLVSDDAEVAPDAMACLAASAALAVSNIPIQEIISEVRVARIGGQMVINPTRSQMKEADMDFIIAATEKNIMMVEGEAKECKEEDMITAIEVAHEAIRKQVKMQEELRAKVGNPEKKEVVQPEINQEIKDKVEAFAKAQMLEISRSGASKHERSGGYKLISEGLKKELFPDLEPGMEPDGAIWGAAKSYLEDLQYHTVRDMILDEGRRLDGRALDVVRPLDMHVDYLPGPHGCALFTRGETQSLTTATLGTSDDELLVENARTSEYRKFILHYNFPPFSTGETKPMRGPGRREVGHGALARRSLEMMMPNPMDYPYTVRVVSDILESNGSSSMATVCAGSLALMDAGVPLPKHVAGVAMGLISRERDGKWGVLTDILGDEDHLGDMDFKVTGTRDGICGIQMDIKVDGLSMDVMRAALEQALRGRLHILDAMYACIPEYRAEMKSHAPRVEQTIIEAEFIGAIIGPGGKIIQEIQRETNTKISVDEADGKGYVKIFSSNGDDLKKAMNWVKSIAAQPEIGEEYEGTVKSIMPFGAFIEFMPGKQGLLHISEVSWSRLDSLEGVMTEGDKVKVKLIGTDPKTGKLRLSRKVLMPQPEGYQEPERRERSDRGDRGDRPRGEGRFDRGDRPRGEGRGEGGRGSDRGDRPRGEGRGEGGRGSDRGDRGPRREDRGDRRDDRPRREFQNDGQGGGEQTASNNDTQSRPNEDWNPASTADNGQGSGGFASPAPQDDDKDLML